MATIVVEVAEWPIVLVRFPSEVQDDDLRRYLSEVETLRARKMPYVLVIDISQSPPLTPVQRKMQAAYIEEESKLERLFLRGVAFVAPTAIHRGILTAIFWLQQSPVQHEAFGKLGEARSWARRVLALSVARGTERASIRAKGTTS